MRDLIETKRAIANIIYEAVEKEMFSEYNEENKLKVLDYVRAEVSKLKEAGDLDDFFAGWFDVHDFLKGWMCEFTVYFTVGQDIDKLSVIDENWYGKFHEAS